MDPRVTEPPITSSRRWVGPNAKSVRHTADVSSMSNASDGLAWTADGKEIVFASNRGGLWRLWRVSTSGGTPELVHGVGEGAGAPTISPRGDRLAYVQARADANLWRTAGPASKDRRAAPVK